jgi:hypothetical protein
MMNENCGKNPSIYQVARTMVRPKLTQEAAAGRIEIGVRQLQAIEALDAPAPAYIVAKMRIEYNAPWLPEQHCRQSCPLGDTCGAADIEASPNLAAKVIHFVKELADNQAIRERLIAIVDDGVIGPDELAELDAIEQEMDHLAQAARSLRITLDAARKVTKVTEVTHAAI